jgi:hypothetical protein
LLQAMVIPAGMILYYLIVGWVKAYVRHVLIPNNSMQLFRMLIAKKHPFRLTGRGVTAGKIITAIRLMRRNLEP